VTNGTTGRVGLLTGIASFPADIRPPPREWAERFFDVRHWTQMPRGGHFAALELPGLLPHGLPTFSVPCEKKSGA
jgi:microsomal epoxide hydrolase